VSAIAEPRGHRETVAGLWRARARGRLPHALLFEGPAGIGKFLAARWFAQGLFCERGDEVIELGPCGECGGCKRCAAGTHPDLFVLDPNELDKETIQVEHVAAREGGGAAACDFFALRAMEGGARVLLLRELERATPQAQNALLKTLEEPGEGALLVVESSRPDLLLETVRSRCVRVRFEPLAREDALAVLREAGRAEAEIERLVTWCAGSPGRALDMAREGAPEVRERIARVLRGELDPLRASAEVLELPGELPGETPAARARARARSSLELVVSILRDGLRRAADDPSDGLAHADLAEDAPARGTRWEAALREVVALCGEVELNLPPQGILDRAFLALSGMQDTARG